MTEIFTNNIQEEPMCRICHSSDVSESQLLHPCLCKGSMKYIHEDCFFDCLKNSPSRSCRICKYEFKFNKVFDEEMPKNIPINLFAHFIFKLLSSYFSKIYCSFYFIFKYSIIIMINSLMFDRLIFTVPDGSLRLFLLILLGVAATFINFLHVYFYRMIILMISGPRSIVINPRRSLSNMTGDLISRTGSSDSNVRTSNFSVNTQLNEESLDGDSIQDSSTESTSANAFFTVNILEPPSFNSLKTDLFRILSYCSFSFSLIFISTCSRFAKLLEKTLLLLNNSSSIYKFFYPPSISYSTALLYSFFIYTIILCLISYLLLNHTSFTKAKIIYYYCRIYLGTVTSTMVAYTMIGTVVHYSIFVFVNNSRHIMIFQNALFTLQSHLFLGMFMCKIIHSLKSKLVLIFRPGLVNSFFKKNNIVSIFRFTLETPLSVQFANASFTIISISSVILGITLVQSLVFDLPPLVFSGLDLYQYLFLVKMFLVYCNSTKGSSEIFCYIFTKIIKFLSKIFGLENYFFNKKISKFDRNRIIWDLNVNFTKEKYKRKIQQINRIVLLAKDENSLDNNLVNEICSAEKFKRPSANRASTVSKSNNDSFRSKSAHPPSSSLSFNQENIKLIQEKYKITDKKIQNYFCSDVQSKYALFYKPRFYIFYKFIMYAACFFTSQLLFFLPNYFSIYLSNFDFGVKKNFIFVTSFTILFRGFSYLSLMIEHEFLKAFKIFLKCLIVHIYTNIFWPIFASLSYIFLFSSPDRILLFSRAFLFFFSISIFIEYFMKITSFSLHIENYSFRFIIMSLIQWTVLQVVLLILYLTYSQIIGALNFFITIATILMFSFLVNCFKEIFSGKFSEKIREKYFLKKNVVLNYEENS